MVLKIVDRNADWHQNSITIEKLDKAKQNLTVKTIDTTNLKINSLS